MRASTTVHHAGKETRVIPLFEELRPYLEAVRDEANPGIDVPFSAPGITPYRDTNANLRTQLERIIVRAGLVPWPKLSQNLRSSLATDLANNPNIPDYVATGWLGHSNVIANRHYRQILP